VLEGELALARVAGIRLAEHSVAVPGNDLGTRLETYGQHTFTYRRGKQ
jgi:hypothetical protein